MKAKDLFRTFVLLAVVVSMVGSVQPAFAQSNLDETDPEVIVREMTYWDATYTGYVDATRFEKWPFVFDGDYEFSVTVTPISGDLVPTLILLDIDGNELGRGTGSLTSSQIAGNYFIQIEPEAGSGFYELTIREFTEEPVVEDPDVSAVALPEAITLEENAVVTVTLNNVPEEGYTSAEFACTYPFEMVAVSNIVVTELFGTDAAIAINDPQDGGFIVAIAGSNGQKALVNGDVFTLDIAGLVLGQAAIECVTRVSAGDSVLTDLAPAVATLTIEDVVVEGSIDGQVIASKPVTINLYDLEETLIATVLTELDGTFSLTAPVGTYTIAAEASGFLGAQGSALVVAGEISTKATANLLAGDIDGNGVIDQFDAMTIGMSYNTADPEAADLNADAIINVLDLELLAANYRAADALNWE